MINPHLLSVFAWLISVVAVCERMIRLDLAMPKAGGIYA
jgi:hypothetical protein